MDSHSSGAGPGRETRAAIAEEIAVEASRLARKASAGDLGFLAYLIDMAVLEAWRAASDPDNNEYSEAEMKARKR